MKKYTLTIVVTLLLSTPLLHTMSCSLTAVVCICLAYQCDDEEQNEDNQQSPTSGPESQNMTDTETPATPLLPITSSEHTSDRKRSEAPLKSSRHTEQ